MLRVLLNVKLIATTVVHVFAIVKVFQDFFLFRIYCAWFRNVEQKNGDASSLRLLAGPNMIDTKGQTNKVYQPRMLFVINCALQMLTSRFHVPILLLPAFVPFGHTWVHVCISNSCTLPYSRPLCRSTCQGFETSIRYLLQEKQGRKGLGG